MTLPTRTLECLDRLIGFDTVSRNSNLECIDWARSRLEAEGAEISLDWNVDRSKANLFATFGKGPNGIIYSGHVDVVPVDGQAWTSDPFKMAVRDGKAFGRGACDMKGFVASVIAHAPEFAKAGRREPVHVALTYDEELGCLGIPRLIEHLRGRGIKPAGCLVGEPTSMRLVSAHKGGEIYRCKVTGKAAHSSLTPRAVNAVQIAARIVARIDEISLRMEREGLRVPGFDVEHTTISTNLMSGGNGANIVPAEAEFLFDFRFVPGDDPETIFAEIRDYAERELVPRMKAIDPQCGVAFTRINRVPALSAKAGDKIYDLVRGLVDDPNETKVSYGTEASFFEAYGVPAVVCGPGSIEQAHKADEFVAVDQLARCDRLIEAMCDRAG